jgi:nucleoside phosphorylase
MGKVSAALLTSKLIEYERPRFVAMPGICAGVKKKVQFGDIVAADPVWDWQSGKHFVDEGEHGFAIAPEPVVLASFVRARFDQFRASSQDLTEIRRAWPSPPNTELSLRAGPLATGSAVVADLDVLDNIIGQNRALLAVDMEGYGVASACDTAGHPRPTALICKSVCDFADEEKDDKWQTYAAYTSVAAIKLFFERYMHEIVDLAGNR